MRLSVALLGLLLLVVGCGGSESPDPAASPTRVSADGVHLTLPVGWQQAASTLTPRLIDPRELISVGTFDMNPGGKDCSQLPERAYRQMNADDALVTILERDGEGSSAPRRPRHFRFEPSRFECLPERLIGAEYFFRDSGRNLYAFVAIGNDGSRGQVASVLDSLRVERGETSGDSASAQLQRCRDDGRTGGPSPSAINWEGSVAGISCDAAGALIQDSFIPAFGNKVLSRVNVNSQRQLRKGPPGDFKAAGFSCHYSAMHADTGWALRCEQGDRAMEFNFTP